MQKAHRQKEPHIIAITLAAAGFVASAGFGCAETLTFRAVKPLQAISLDVGSKHLAGYFVNAEGRCDLTMMIADAYREDREPSTNPTLRVQLTVDAGKPAHLDTAEGKIVQLDCANGAQAMSATLRDQVAYFAPVK